MLCYDFHASQGTLDHPDEYMLGLLGDVAQGDKTAWPRRREDHERKVKRGTAPFARKRGKGSHSQLDRRYCATARRRGAALAASDVAPR